MLFKKDFTLVVFEKLLLTFREHGYVLTSYENLIQNKYSKVVVLKHDVDAKPKNSALTAQIENKIGAVGSYYFRIIKKSNDPDIIEIVKNLGHEIGYHYEDLAQNDGDYEKAIINFRNNLKYFRKYYNVKTICMHGSPMSKWDNRLIWHKYNYRDYEIIGDLSYDFDFSEYAYFTDTGRSWNDKRYSVRDIVSEGMQFKVKSTYEFINLISSNKLPSKIVINFHPQRWNNNYLDWSIELITQKLKNIIKRILLLIRRRV